MCWEPEGASAKMTLMVVQGPVALEQRAQRKQEGVPEGQSAVVPVAALLVVHGWMALERRAQQEPEREWECHPAVVPAVALASIRDYFSWGAEVASARIAPVVVQGRMALEPRMVSGRECESQSARVLVAALGRTALVSVSESERVARVQGV